MDLCSYTIRIIDDRREIKMKSVELLAIRLRNGRGMAVCLKPKTPYVMTNSIVNEIKDFQKKVVGEYYSKPWNGIYFIVWYLHSSNIPWKGFDFDFIYNSFLNHNEVKVENYIEDVFELLFINYVGLGLPLLSCSIVNRETHGISKEFFLLNRINFIKKNGKNISTNNAINLEKIQPHFSPKIYMRNSIHEMEKFNISAINEVLYFFKFDSISECELQDIKHHFDEIRRKTILKIYEFAKKDIHLLRRISELQSFEHRKWTKYNLI